jgi:hypothetical protein
MDFSFISHPDSSEDIDMVIDDKDMCLDYDEWRDTLEALDSSFHHVRYSLWIQEEEELQVLHVSFDMVNGLVLNYKEEITD